MLTVTPTVDEPPFNLVEIDAGAGKFVQSVTVTRDGDDLLAPAVAGFQQSATNDYCVPYGKAATYRAVGKYGLQDYQNIWDDDFEDASSMDDWVQSVAGWKSNGGASAIYASPAPLIQRDVTGLSRLYVQSPVRLGLELLDANYNVVLRVQSFSQFTRVMGTVLDATGSYFIRIESGKAFVQIGSMYNPQSTDPSATVNLSGTPVRVQMYPLLESVQSSAVTSDDGTFMVSFSGSQTEGFVAWQRGDNQVGMRMATIGETSISLGAVTYLDTDAKLTKVSDFNDVGYVALDDGTYWKADGTQSATFPSLNNNSSDSMYSSSGSRRFWMSNAQLLFANLSASVSEITAENYMSEPVIVDFDETVTVTLDSEDAWLVHPHQPSLSVRMPKKYSTAGIVSLGDRVQSANATVHKVLGSRLPVVTRFGSGRSAPVYGSVTVATGTPDEAAALDTLVQDETPLWVDIPSGWSARLPAGFYAVGDVTDTPAIEYAGDWRERWTLPLTQVRAPKTVVIPLWNCGTVLLTFQTSLQILDTYVTSYDLLIDNRKAS